MNKTESGEENRRKKKETKCHVICNKKRDTLNRGHDRVMTGDFCGRCHRKFQSGNKI